MIERAGRVVRPVFLFKCSRGPSPWDGHRPVIPTGLKIGTAAYSCRADTREG